MSFRRRSHHAALAALALLLAAAAPAAADHFKPGSLRLSPARTGSASTLVINAGFDQKPNAQLQAYNVYIARGFRFDPRAVAGRCTVAQAHSSRCPGASRIGGGSADVTISGSAATFGVDFYLTPAQQHGDIAGVVLSVHQPGVATGGGFALVGRLVRLGHGPFGLELRFADTAKELPPGATVQLNHIRARIGTRHGGRSLLRTPRACRSSGWPFRLFIAYSTGSETYSGPAACSSRGG